MGLSRNVSLSTALRYKGEGPFLAFILHRIGGSALFIFFTMYILALAGVKPVSAIFANWVFQIVILTFGLFHAINGLRITLLDLWPPLIEHYRKAIQVEAAVYILVLGFALFAVIRNAFGG